MKLQTVPARTGLAWVRAGVTVFLKQPLAMAGLFFLFTALLSVASLLPWVGLPLAMMLLPTATLGLMAAAREARAGRFPMPLMLFAGWRGGAAKTRVLLQMGVLYALGFALVLGATTLIDGGDFARLYTGGNLPEADRLQDGHFATAAWVFVGLHLPLSLTFWHAPALAFWHDVPLAKALFFSAVACWRNLGAFALFGLGWVALMVALVGLIALTGLAQTLAFPAMMLLAAMFFSALETTFSDSFVADDAPAPAHDATP